MDDYREASFWSVIPDTVLSATNIKPNAKLLYAKVTSLQTAKGYCYASNRYLADGLGIEPDTVTRLLRELVEAGYLRIEIVRDPETNGVIERQIYPTICLPVLPLPSRINILDPPGQTSETLPDKYPSRDVNVRDIEEIPPKAPQRGGRKVKKQADWRPELFDRFWKLYPRGENKQGTIRAWDRLRPDDQTIVQMSKALKRQMKSEDWQKGIGIPYASTWLNGRRWEDEVKDAPAAAAPDRREDLPEW